jgi:DNA repair exonuclease SbcCD ATPase subunit
MKKQIENLFQRLTNRQRERSSKRINDIKQLVILISNSESGAAKVDIDLDCYAEVLSAENFSEADLRANINRYKARVNWSRQASQLDELHSKAEQLADAVKQFDHEEFERHKRALTQLEQMRRELSTAESAAINASSALSELQASALRVDDSRELCERLSEVNSEIAELQAKLNPNQPANLGGNRWGSLAHTPAWLARQTRGVLDDKKSPLTPERRKQLESQLTAAERAVGQAEKELGQSQKRRDSINAKLSVRPEDSLRPENFSIVRSRKKPEVLRVHPFTGKVLTGVTPQ